MHLCLKFFYEDTCINFPYFRPLPLVKLILIYTEHQQQVLFQELHFLHDTCWLKKAN